MRNRVRFPSNAPDAHPGSAVQVYGGYSDPGGERSHDLRIKSPLLYQLSYRV